MSDLATGISTIVTGMAFLLGFIASTLVLPTLLWWVFRQWQPVTRAGRAARFATWPSIAMSAVVNSAVAVAIRGDPSPPNHLGIIVGAWIVLSLVLAPVFFAGRYAISWPTASKPDSRAP